VDLPAIPEAIKRAGFTPGEMIITALGTLEQRAEDQLFRVYGWPDAYPINDAADYAGGYYLRAVVDYSGSVTLRRID